MTENHTETGAVREEFLGLLCDDPDMLRAEFEEIIAAAWPEPPLTPRARGPARHDQHTHPAPPGQSRDAQRPEGARLNWAGRQRSPPG